MTNFAQNIFGVELQHISLEHLIDFFDEQRLENDTLEFKSFHAQANFDQLFLKILKTLCGYLNGGGGLLIWGAPTKRTDGEIDYFHGALTPIPVQKSVDWFINKISTSISPMPIDILVKIINLDQSYIYLFEVQESKYKPHQLDHIYYIRLDGQTKPAPHFIVQALMRQITYPDVRACLRINRLVLHAGDRIAKLAIAIFNFSQLQNEVDFNYTLTIVGGGILYGWHPNQVYNDITVDMEGAQIISKTFKRPLHFGMPFIRTFQITVPINVDEIIYMLTFGGKYSPAKVCTYKLDLRNVNVNNPQGNITILEDNELFKAKKTIDESLSFFRNNEVI